MSRARRFPMEMLGLLFALSSGIAPAKAQSFNNLIFFSDSNTDSGRYVYIKQHPATDPTLAVGGYTTNPGLMWSTALGQRFGVTVTPSDAPGGGNNCAAGGARVVFSSVGNNAWSATQQVTAYLASVNGVASPDTLYTVNIGINDLKTTTSGGPGNIVLPQNVAALTTLGQQTAGLVTQLHAAGARYFLVPNMFGYQSAGAATAAGSPYGAGAITVTASRNLYSQTVWNTIAGSGVNFVPADTSTLLNYVLVNAGSFGITHTSINDAACGSVSSNFCSATDWVAPNADQTYFYADGFAAANGGGHLTSAVQRIESDYYFALLAAPSQISFLAEAGIKSRLALVGGVRDQIGLSFSRPGNVGTWISGDVQALRLRNADYYPIDPGHPVSLTIGLDFKPGEGWLAGAAVGYGGTTQTFDKAGGHYTANEIAGSLYGGYRGSALWADAVATAGARSFDVDRRVALGIATFSNRGSTTGNGLSIAGETGYDFARPVGPTGTSVLKHGPVAGFIEQRVTVDGFTETSPSGAPTALAFGSQVRHSAISELGYRASLSVGAFEPFAKVTWDHEFAAGNRQVWAALTSVTSPAYSMPAVRLGSDFASAEVGSRYAFSDRVAGLVTLSGQFAQSRASVYALRGGLNMRLD